MLNIFSYVTVGVVAGMTSGLIGIGGGIIIVPCLVYFFGFPQHTAQGTTLAMFILPMGLVSAITYYRQGYVNFTAAGLICIGFVLGSYFGAKFAVGFSEIILRKIFGGCLLLVAVYMISAN